MRKGILFGILLLVVGVSSPTLHAAPNLFVSDVGGIKIFDAQNGDYLGEFGDTDGENLLGTVIHPVTGNLLAGHIDGYINEYNAETGALIGKFGNAENHVVTPADLIFHPVTGNLFVLEEGASFPTEVLPVVQEYDGTTGNFLGNFGATQGNLTAFGAQRFAFSAVTGSLLVSDRRDVREFDGSTGAYGGIFGTTDTDTGTVTDVAVHPGTGNIFVADRSNDDIREFDATTGAFVTNYDAGGGVFRNPIAIAFTPATPEPPDALSARPIPTTQDDLTPYFGHLLVLHDPTVGEIVTVLELLTNSIRFEMGDNRITSAINMLYNLPTLLSYALSNASLEQSGNAADPVNTFTGELYEELPMDLNFGGPLPLTFNRYYASNLKTDGNIRSSLGDNWLHNYDFKLTQVGPQITVINNRGRVITFEDNGAAWELTGKKDMAFQLSESGSEFVMLDPRTGRMYRFNVKGKLTRIEDGKGNSLRLTHSDDGLLTYISGGQGANTRAREMFFTYSFEQLNGGGPRKLIKITDRGPTRTVLFSQTGSDLSSVTDTRGHVTSYTYDPGSLLTGMQRPEGNTPFTQMWNGRSQVASQMNDDGHQFEFTYTGLDTTIEDPLGNTLVHTHTDTGEFTNRVDEIGMAFKMGSDSTGRRDSLTDRFGDTTRAVYHPESGNVQSVTNANGTSYSYDYTPRVLNGVTHYDLTDVTHADGTTETLVYDVAGNLTSHTDEVGNDATATFDADGQPLTLTNRRGGTTVNTYNDDATLATSKDPANNTTMFGYDAQRRVNLITYADTSSRGMTYDLANNLLTSTDPNGGTSTFTYDLNGNLATAQDRLLRTTLFTYDGNDRLLTTTDPLSGVRSRTYTPLGKLSSITDENGNTTTLGYDSRVRLTSLTNALGHVWATTYDLEGIIASSTDPLLHTRTYVSDTMGRITQSTSPLGYTSGVTYDPMGRVKNTTDELGATTHFERDARGLLEKVTLPGGGIAASYDRNEFGQVTEITDPNNQIWMRDYDNMGRLKSMTDPLANTETTTYDNRNRPETTTFSGGLGTLTYSYDANGNLTNRTYSDGTTYNYEYDANDRLTSADGVALAYDANGSITNSNGIGIERDLGRRITQITLAPGKTITYEYDANNRLTNVTDWAAGSTSFTYDDAGRLMTITRPNGVHSSRAYDDDDRLIGLGEGALSAISLTRDGRGQITSASRNVPEATSIDTLSTVTSTFDAASQIVGPLHDAMGRLTSDTDRTFVWDLSSRLTSVTTTGNAVSATYNALGQRLSRTESGSTRNYVWNYALGLSSISIEKIGANDLRYYVHTPSGRLLYSIDANSNARLVYHFDEMGNTLFLTSDAGSVSAAYAYSPYGEHTAETGTTDTPFTWQGEHGLMNEGNNLYYVRARYYDANTARFLSRDPIKSTTPREINPYQFALGNPLLFIDSSGRRSEPAANTPISESIEKERSNVRSRGSAGAHYLAATLLPELGIAPREFYHSDSDSLKAANTEVSKGLIARTRDTTDLTDGFDALERWQNADSFELPKNMLITMPNTFDFTRVYEAQPIIAVQDEFDIAVQELKSELSKQADANQPRSKREANKLLRGEQPWKKKSKKINSTLEPWIGTDPDPIKSVLPELTPFVVDT